MQNVMSWMPVDVLMYIWAWEVLFCFFYNSFFLKFYLSNRYQSICNVQGILIEIPCKLDQLGLLCDVVPFSFVQVIFLHCTCTFRRVEIWFSTDEEQNKTARTQYNGINAAMAIAISQEFKSAGVLLFEETSWLKAQSLISLNRMFEFW